MRLPARPSADDPLSNPSDIHAGHGARIAGASAEFISLAIGRDQYGVGVVTVREIERRTDIAPLPRQHVRASRTEFLFGLLMAEDTMFAFVNSPKSSAIQPIGGTSDAGSAA